MNWGEALRRMRAGEFDVIDCVVETADRRDYFDFTPAYATIEASIYFRADISGITDLASLKGFPVGVKAGDQHIDQLKANGVTTVIPFENNDAIVEAAQQHKINVFVVDDPSAIYLLNKMGIGEEFRHSPPMFRDELRRAVRKGDAALLSTVVDGFAAIEPGELKEIDEKWFGRTINRYGRYVTYAGYAGVLAILLMAGLVGWNRTLRKRILQRTAALGESEQRFRQIAENIHEVFWLIDMVKQTTLYISPAYEAIWGRTCESLYQAPRSFIAAIHPDDRARVVDTIETDREHGFEVEYRVVRPDGSIRWIWDRGFPIKDKSKRFYRVAGLAEDITGRKQAEERLKATSEQLRALSASLSSAREEEGTRIARELHDEMGSALTSLKWDLESIEKSCSEAGNQAASSNIREKIAGMIEVIDTTLDAVLRISSDLRPTILDDLGLLEAIEWQAQQFEARTGIACQVDSFVENVDLSREKATAVFRVLQEALTNVLRHAHATRVNITIAEEEAVFAFELRDNGRGITEEEKTGSRSLGLIGMRERANLVGGTIEITGNGERGTVLTLRVPIHGQDSA
jgi:PAS domain S-box-containing protein